MIAFTHHLTYDEPESRAFEAILDAIEDGIDVEGLSPEYRAVLADLHATVGWYIGTARLRVPDGWQPAAPIASSHRAPEQVVCERMAALMRSNAAFLGPGHHWTPNLLECAADWDQTAHKFDAAGAS